MADYTELELKTFELSNAESNFSLSATSLALISDVPSSQYSSEKLFQSIQSKEIWLVSPGICRMQIIVVQNQVSLVLGETEPGFLEHLADVICQCPLWPALGLTIKQEDIQYQPLYDGAPNLYFIIEHLDKSSVLLSPPHSPTARLYGIECLFQYQTSHSDASNTDTNESNICDFDMDDYPPEPALQPQAPGLSNDAHRSTVYNYYYWEDPELYLFAKHSRRRWNDAGRLAQMALYVTIGIKKRMRGLRLFQLDSRPSLLELAPAIWNAHYLKAVTYHAANIPIISNILAAPSRNRSASLREKSKRLLIDVDSTLSNKPSTITETEAELNTYRCSIQQRLWDLVQAKLEPTIRIKNASMNIDTQQHENINWPFEIASSSMGSFEEPENSDYLYVLDETSANDFDFDNTHDESRLLYQFQYPPGGDRSSHPDATAEYEQWQHGDQDIRIANEDPLAEVIDTIEVESDYLPDSSLQHDSLIQSSSLLELRGASTVRQRISGDFSNSITDVNHLHTSDYVYGVKGICNSTDELSYNTRRMLWDDMQQHMYKSENESPYGIYEGVIDQSHELREEQTGSQDIDMY
ncbi:hypothetical protein F4813DRAFT_397435 [Daldinia decipiens]|uniref:uncharacterized protein n=1 Tax=Daldinia decipiens TaxID=326647 RepID=UPI0020C52E26|nr:uncharacterized protein F4813DRAFT_397435 [Daldinia decipiens]KAI1656566.1 hypothetical protein F4813DRAFT_397435 [Daldinia decipiens]